MVETHEQRKIPAAALCFGIGEFELADNGKGAKTAPIRLVARAGQPIEHPYFGRVVHDFASMSHKNKIPIDYTHDEQQIIGFVNHFDSTGGDLNLSGTLVPFKQSDRATEIIHNSKAGIPYEASIDFRAPMQMTMLKNGQQQMVNGNMVDGPATVITNWTLRGVAVCPYGADPNTSSQLSPGDEVTVTVFTKEDTMDKESEKVEAPAAVEAEPAAVATPEPVAKPTKPQQLEVAESKAYIDAFGPDGAMWFCLGKTFAEAAILHGQKLAAESAAKDEKIAELMQRLSASGQTGEANPVGFTTAVKPEEQVLCLNGFSEKANRRCNPRYK